MVSVIPDGIYIKMLNYKSTNIIHKHTKIDLEDEQSYNPSYLFNRKL